MIILMTSHVFKSALFTRYSSCFEHGCKGIRPGIVIAWIVDVMDYISRQNSIHQTPIKLGDDLRIQS